MTHRTHADRDWCVLPNGHEGKCLADWEFKLLQHQHMFKSYRGRRYIACRAMDDITSVIANLGIEDGSDLPQPDRPFNPVPPQQVRTELQNLAASLLKVILALNDGMP